MLMKNSIDTQTKNTSILIIKVGGALLNEVEKMDRFFKSILKAKRSVVVVHGGGDLVDNLLNQLDMPSIKIDGLRVTPADQINYVAGMLAGTANRLLQARALYCGLQAVGLSITDGSTCTAEPYGTDFGHVGFASNGKPDFIHLLLGNGYVPIMHSIGTTLAGELMNINADQAAVAVAATLKAELVFLSDVNGVLDKNKQLFKKLNEKNIAQLIDDHTITDGMVVKVNSALDAAKKTQQNVYIASWSNDDLDNLLQGKSAGTAISEF
jgi:acetylglutamate kinase